MKLLSKNGKPLPKDFLAFSMEISLDFDGKGSIAGNTTGVRRRTQ